MSGINLDKFWRLHTYRYIFYRWIVQKLCNEKLGGCSCFMLDAGCGDCGSSLSVFPKNTTFVGVDIKRENLKQSKKIVTDGSFILAILTHLPFISTFDLVVCVDVLEHVPQKAQTLREISRVCRANGELVASTTNIFNPLLFIDTYTPRNLARILTSKFSEKAHYERHQRFSSLSFTSCARKAGFTQVKMAVYGFPLFDPWLYHYSKRKTPFYAHLWVLFDRLTSKMPLRLLKETIVLKATKKTVKNL